MALEARSSQSRCWQGWFLLEILRKNLFHAFLSSWSVTSSLGHSLTRRRITAGPASHHTGFSSCLSGFAWCPLSVPLSPLISRSVTLDEGPTTPQYDLILTHLQQLCFQIRSHSKVLGDRIPACRLQSCWGDTHNSTHNMTKEQINQFENGQRI